VVRSIISIRALTESWTSGRLGPTLKNTWPADLEKESCMDLSDLAPGDVVLRILADEPMKLAYLGTRAGLIYAGFGPDLCWTFDVATGMEVDDEIGWGPAYGRTGSYIAGLERQNPAINHQTIAAAWAELSARAKPA
jgi:hypothetical protein